MTTIPAVLFLIVASTMSATGSWRAADISDRQFLDKLRVQSRSSYCMNAGGKCFSTGQCCSGLVCAAFDDYFGQKPEVPGYCVKEKDLQVCATNSDCAAGSKCASLGRTGERYCLPRLEDGDRREPPAPAAAAASVSLFGRLKGSLGSECRSDADCLSVTEAKNEKLCCQDVRRGRQGIRRVCDRVTAISVCIN